METIRVLLADDHPVVREGLRRRLEGAPDITVLAEASNGVEALRLAEELTPDVLLLDMEMPGLSGVEVARRLRAAGSAVRVLALSAYRDEAYIYGLLEAGAAGYLLKDEMMESIVTAVRGVAQGEEGWFSRPVAEQVARWAVSGVPERKRSSLTSLTKREQEVLALMVQGLNNAEIAEVLTITEPTVKFHVGNIYRKLGVRSRVKAIRVALLIDKTGK